MILKHEGEEVDEEKNGEGIWGSYEIRRGEKICNGYCFYCAL
jgi:hypothetical protein